MRYWAILTVLLLLSGCWPNGYVPGVGWVGTDEERERAAQSYAAEVVGRINEIHAMIAAPESLQTFEVAKQRTLPSQSSLRKEIADARRRWYAEKHPELDDRIRQAIIGGSVGPGFTTEQVLASWGKPDEVHRTGYAQSIHEQWVYGEVLYDARFLYFEDGVLTAWQD